MLPIAFDSLALLCCVYAFHSGGRTGKACVLAVGLAIALTLIPEPIDPHHAFIDPMQLVADSVALVAFSAVAFRSRRRWPMWMAGMQLNGVVAHIVGLISPTLVGPVYYAMVTAWGAPILLVMVIGVWLDRRHDRRRRDDG